MKREKALRALRASTKGWTRERLCAAYEAFGFERSENSKHIGYYHPQIRKFSNVKRGSAELLEDYPRAALKLFEEVLAFEAAQPEQQDAEGAGPNVG